MPELHQCCENSDTVNDVQSLLLADPQAAHTRDAKHMLPLHHCFRNETSAAEQIVRAVLQSWPASIAELDGGGRPVIAACARYTHSVLVLRLIVSRAPDTIEAADEYGDTAVHAALRNKGPQAEALASYLLEVWPEGAQVRGDYRCYPLHLACSYSMSLAFISKLINAFPEALMAPDEYDELPLHLACRKAEDVSLVEPLIDANLQAVSVACDCGEYPVHLMCSPPLCSLPATAALVTRMSAYCPEALLRDAARRGTPLYLASTYCDDAAIVSALLDACPEVVASSSPLGGVTLAL